MRTLVVLTCLLFTTAAAAEIQGVHFDDQATIGDSVIPLRGTALQRWKVMFRVHVTGWWQDPASEVLADVPKRLELRYFHDISAKDFVKATDEGLSKSCADPAVYAALSAERTAWNALYQDIADGSRYTITYAPGAGTTLAKDGVALGTVAGAEFAARLFGIWLGDHPVSTDHRDDLRDGK